MLNNINELPLGFGIALAKNNGAMQYFASLTPTHRQEIIERTHTISSKEEMEKFVGKLERAEWI